MNEDLRNEIRQLIREELRIVKDKSNWTDPNNRRFDLMLNNEVITSFSFDVVQQREYEG